MKHKRIHPEKQVQGRWTQMSAPAVDTANPAYSALVRQLCDCTAIDATQRGQPCRACGKRIISREEERWLLSQIVITPDRGVEHDRP